MPQNVNLRDLLIVIVEEEDVLAVVDQFLHHHVLTLANELVIGPRDRLQEVDVLDVALVSLDVVDEKAEKRRRRAEARRASSTARSRTDTQISSFLSGNK